MTGPLIRARGLRAIADAILHHGPGREADAEIYRAMGYLVTTAHPSIPWRHFEGNHWYANARLTQDAQGALQVFGRRVRHDHIMVVTYAKRRWTVIAELGGFAIDQAVHETMATAISAAFCRLLAIQVDLDAGIVPGGEQAA